jgi:hypothetical protein
MKPEPQEHDEQTDVTHERDVTMPYMAFVTVTTLMDVT